MLTDFESAYDFLFQFACTRNMNSYTNLYIIPFICLQTSLNRMFCNFHEALTTIEEIRMQLQQQLNRFLCSSSPLVNFVHLLALILFTVVNWVSGVFSFLTQTPHKQWQTINLSLEILGIYFRLGSAERCSAFLQFVRCIRGYLSAANTPNMVEMPFSLVRLA